LVLLIAVAAILTGCIGRAPTETPIPHIIVQGGSGQHHSVVVMLPGAGDRAGTFIEHGFEEAGQLLGFDTIAVDAHYGYYAERSLIPRLHEDVVLPARAAGYDRIWLLGISMGGFGALLYAEAHPEQVDGIILLAPFLGDSELAKAVSDSGGLAAWSGEGPRFKDYEVDVWRWLKATIAAHSTPVILGFGQSDRGAKSHRVIADALPARAVYTRDGGHDWGTWSTLWSDIAADLAR
jgi:pimeloyl-ACP methyl ester carboxylesterase